MRTPSDVAIRRLAIARLISVGGSMAAYTAFIDLVYVTTGGSAVYLSLAILLTIGAAGLLEPLGGIVADRFDRKLSMIWSDLAGSALFVLLALVHAPWLLLSIALLTALAETPFRAGSVASIPNLVDDEAQIAKANGWVGMGSSLGITVGPALGGVMTGWLGAETVFLLNALSFVVSAGLVWSIRASFSGKDLPEDAAAADGGFSAGFRFVVRDRVLLVVTAAWMVLLLGMGLGIVADRPLAEHFETGAAGFGAMIGMWGFGSVVGAWAASKMTAAIEARVMVVGFAIAGVAGIGIWLSPLFALIIACNFFWGFGDSLTVVAEQGILQRRTPDRIRARVVAANESLVHASLMAGFLAGAPALRLLGPQAAYGVGGIAALVAGAMAVAVVGAASREAGDAVLTGRETARPHD